MMKDKSAVFSYSIQEACLEDLETIYQIELKSFKNPWSYENYINELGIPFSYIITAKIEKEIIGFALFWIVKDQIHLNKIAVIGKYRRMGVAAALIDYIITRFREGAKIIYLEVREKNSGARRFYEKLGFRENGVRKNYYPDDNAVMIEKELTPSAH